MLKIKLVFFLFPLLALSGAWGAEPEVHSFIAEAQVKYRCYEGTEEEENRDSLTDEVCYGETVDQTVFKETVKITISNDGRFKEKNALGGGWDTAFRFKGRTFFIELSLFKDTEAPGDGPYSLRAVIGDNAPRTRTTDTTVYGSEVAAFSPLAIGYTSEGQPEDISFTFRIKPE